MFRNKKKRVTIAVVSVVAIMPAATGCSLSGLYYNQPTFNLNIPLGLDGFGGLLNPFGIITALVNTFIGSTFPGTGIGPLVTNVPTGTGGSTVPPPALGGS
jgi:hypothetical protein